jgi:DNA-binding MarR family transcriptional regulator
MSASRERAAVGLWVRLAKCYGLVLREVRDAQADSKVTLAQFDVLAQLLRHEDGMTVGQLSAVLLVTAGNVTGLVDRMSARGWVTRRASVDDQRVRIVRLTAAGRRIAVREVQRQEELLGRVFGALSKSEQSSLSLQLDRVRQLLEASRSVADA